MSEASGQHRPWTTDRSIVAEIAQGMEERSVSDGCAKFQNVQASVPEGMQLTRSALEERIEVLESALHRIADWGNAYPKEAFPRPDETYYANAHRILGAHTLSLDRIAADCMRHAVQGCARIAREALDGPTEG